MSRRRSRGTTPCRILFAGAAFLFVVVAGCATPVADGLVAVRGRVTLDGAPLPRGSVSFRGAPGGTNWDQPTGMIGADGQYVIFTNGREGAAPGKYRVVVFATDAANTPTGAAHPTLPRSLIPARYNDPQRSPLQLDVTSAAEPRAYDLELKSHDN